MVVIVVDMWKEWKSIKISLLMLNFINISCLQILYNFLILSTAVNSKNMVNIYPH